MNIDSFLSHHALVENPFEAEEARHDPVFARSIGGGPCHPDFHKILGQIDPPSTSIVFGEKGSGKTATRLLIGRRVHDHNQENPDRQTLLVAYDDLNPLLDHLMARRRRTRRKEKDIVRLLDDIRLEDHQDAILSLAMTKVVDMLITRGTDCGEAMAPPAGLNERIKKAPRRLRVDAAVLAALYDQPRSGGTVQRWRNLRSRLRLGWTVPLSWIRMLVILLTIVAVVLCIAHFATRPGGIWTTSARASAPPLQTAETESDPESTPEDIGQPLKFDLAANTDGGSPWLSLLAGMAGALALVLGVIWLQRHASLWRLSRRIAREMRAMDHSPGQLRQMLLSFRRNDLDRQIWPLPGAGSRDSRYELTARLVSVLKGLGFGGILVVVDRVDEPTMVSGKAERMRAVIWPLLDNKFLQQEGLALKLLLPIELRHMLHRESADFFQEARLDKQNLIDPLTWSGATLYDLCSARLGACSSRESNEPFALTDLFETDVTREMIVDALEQMHQPRDAFKFLYTLIQEHCRTVPEEQASFKIPRLTVDAVRRAQAQRVQDLQRGVSPA